MGVNNRCFLYNENLPKWAKCRLVIAGEDAVKEAEIKYLPKPPCMDREEYLSYIGRAEFFNATGRTLDGLHGLIFRNDPIIEMDGKEAVEKYLANVDRKGSSVTQFVSDKCYDVLQTGWGGVLIDSPTSNAVSIRDAEQMGVSPYLIGYRAEDIINWHYETDGRKEMLTLVVLREKYEKMQEDGFTAEPKIRYRVLDLVDGVYRQRVYEDDDVLTTEIYPQKSGRPLNYIPFYFMPSKEPEKPMLLDLVNVNLAWYRKSADYESGLHYVSVPTPYTTGWTPPDGDGKPRSINERTIKLGSGSFVHFPEDVVGVGMLEFSGSGMNALASAMAQDEERMAILGARIIAAEKRGIEAVDTARIHRAGENSVLATFANNMSIVFSKIIKDYLEWCMAREGVEVTVSLNTDYDVSQMSAGELTAFVSAWQNGAISRSQLHKNLQRGEIIDADLTLDDMLEEMEKE